ncbi:MAG: TRAP transporter large permease [Pseudomonadota bacterium]
MGNLELAGAFFALLMVLIFLRMPIGLAMLLCGIGGSVAVTGSTVPVLAQMKTMVFDTFSSYSLSIVPLFLLMGQFATRGGMSAALFKAAEAALGRLKGGVAMAAVGACAAFGAICGSSLATAATMGQVALPEMRKYGYSDALATGALAAGGTLGILIPPSIVLVIYAILAEQNIAKLFMAALIPGLLASLGYILAIAVAVRLKPSLLGTSVDGPPVRSGATAKDIALGVLPVLVIFFVVIGGISFGFFTPTEGAAVGAAATGIAAVTLGGMGWRSFVGALQETATATGMIFFIVLGAAFFNTFLGFSQLPQTASAWVGSLDVNPYWVLFAVLFCYLVFGCVMDSLSMILLTVPIFFPMMSELDFGLTPEEFALWFGIMVLVVVEVGLITPPVGMNLFVINSMAKGVPISTTYGGVMPFIMTDVLRVVILIAFPALSLFLVRWLF